MHLLYAVARYSRLRRRHRHRCRCHRLSACLNGIPFIFAILFSLIIIALFWAHIIYIVHTYVDYHSIITFRLLLVFLFQHDCSMDWQMGFSATANAFIKYSKFDWMFGIVLQTFHCNICQLGWSCIQNYVSSNLMKTNMPIRNIFLSRENKKPHTIAALENKFHIQN